MVILIASLFFFYLGSFFLLRFLGLRFLSLWCNTLALFYFFPLRSLVYMVFLGSLGLFFICAICFFSICSLVLIVCFNFCQMSTVPVLFHSNLIVSAFLVFVESCLDSLRSCGN